MCLGPKKGKTRVLVIDGNQDCADSLCLLVTALGGSAHAAYSGREGIEAFARLNPDVTIIELSLPDMKGTDVAARVRPDIENGAKLVATDGGHWVKRDLIASLFDDLLLKPISVDAIESLLGCGQCVGADQSVDGD